MLPLGALADQSGRPTDVSANPSDSVTTPDDDSSAGAPEKGMRRHHPTDEEWQIASSLLGQYSPKRIAVVKQLSDGPLKERLRDFIYGRYLALLKVKESFPQVYQLQLQRMTIEDNIFDLRRQFRQSSGPRRETLRASLRQQVQAMFDNVQQDRQLRINHMKSWVADLQAKKDADESNREKVIDQQLREVILKGPNALGHDRETRTRFNGPGANTSEPSGEPGYQFHPTTNP